MDDIKCFAEEVLVDDEGDVRLAGTLCAGNDADTRAAKRAKELAGNAWCMLHVLAHDSDRSKTLLSKHGEHGAVLNLLLELEVQYAASFVGINIPLSARQVKMRRLTPMTPTIERPATVMSVVPLMLEMPLMLRLSSFTSSLMMEPGASGLKVFLMRMGMCLMQTG